MVRYSLRDVFCLQTLAPISAGVVFTAESFSGAVLVYFDPTVDLLIDSIASATGRLPHQNRTLFLITLSAFEGIIYGGMFALVMLSLFLLRNRWATLVAFSLPFGILFYQCLRFWIMAFPVNAGMAFFVAKVSIIPALLATCLLFLGWRFINRMPTHELGAETAFFQRPPWQRYLLAATCVIYLSASAYGWYGMVSFRTEMIKTWHHLEQSEQQAVQ